MIWGLFAVADPQTTLASGNILAILALIIVTLSGVVIWQQRRFDKVIAQKDDLQDKRLQDNIDFRKRYEEVLEAFSQTSKLLLAKLSGKEE